MTHLPRPQGCQIWSEIIMKFCKFCDLRFSEISATLSPTEGEDRWIIFTKTLRKSTNWIKGFVGHQTFLIPNKYEQSTIHLNLTENPESGGSEDVQILKKTFWVQILRGFLEKFESMSIDLKNAENRIQKYWKAKFLQQNEKNCKTGLFFLAVSRSIRDSNNDLLKSNDL